METTGWKTRARVAASVLALLVLSSNYTIQGGDTLSQIAQRLGVPTAVLAEANGISNANLIYAGQVLTIPGDKGSTASPTPGASHKVAPGESLSVIAKRYGVTVSELAATNNIADPNRIIAGATLRLADTPAPPAVAVATAKLVTASHTVSPGETLSEIAKQLGVSTTALADANRISNPNRIVVGAVLSLPGGGGGGAAPAAPARTFACPVPGGDFNDDFGAGRGSGRSHEGNDIFAQRGDPVLAPVDGTVRQVTGPRGGYQFVLTGADGTSYIGTHMDGFGADGRVSAGTLIGIVGDSGNARGTPPHLHFEMHRGGQVINPFPALTAACG